MGAPELKQFSDLKPGDFARHPVWIGCHTADYDEPWYDETDEETFRPWTGTLPVGADEGMLLVRAILETKDGTQYGGFVTPAMAENELGTQQPQIFVGEQRFQFWGGILGVSEVQRREFYAALSKSAEEVFPLKFNAVTGLTRGFASGQIDGFYRFKVQGRVTNVER